MKLLGSYLLLIIGAGMITHEFDKTYNLWLLPLILFYLAVAIYFVDLYGRQPEQQITPLEEAPDYVGRACEK